MNSHLKRERELLVETASEDEAHYLCAALNSAPSRLVVAAYAVQIQMSTHILENIAVPKYDAKNQTHKLLADLSRIAHGTVATGPKHELSAIETRIDQSTAQLWSLSVEELEEISRSMEEM